MKANEASRKDQFYRLLAATGQALNTYPPDRFHPRFVSIGYTESLAQQMGVGIQNLRRSLRAMRTDACLIELSELETNLLDFFAPTAEIFLQAYSSGPNHISQGVKQLDEMWDRKSVGSFYRTLYETLTRPSAFKIWPPYETEFMSVLYGNRISSGSPLTLFDKLVLTKDLLSLPAGVLECRLRNATGIKYDSTITYVHRRVLLTGKPESGYRS